MCTVYTGNVWWQVHFLGKEMLDHISETANILVKMHNALQIFFFLCGHFFNSIIIISSMLEINV